MKRVRKGILFLAVPAVCLALAAPVAASFSAVFADFKADERVEGCAWTPAQLRAALSDVPADIEQYAPSFIDEVNRGLTAHASGACDKSARSKKKAEPVATGRDRVERADEATNGKARNGGKRARHERDERADEPLPSLEPEGASVPFAPIALGVLLLLGGGYLAARRFRGR